ncbi:hypothetical protein PMAYCL1PPCAC_30399, partial [Pristionchus mayeri]
RCSYWTKNGFCNHTFYNEHYKKQRCATACGLCSTPNPTGVTGACVDTIQQCASYVSQGYCSIPGGRQTCCATCTRLTPTTGQPSSGVDIGSILSGLGGIIPGLGGGGSGGQQPQPQTGNTLGALGSILGGLTGGGGGQGGEANPLAALGNVLPQIAGGGGGGTNPLSTVTNGLGAVGNLANLAGLLG